MIDYLILNKKIGLKNISILKFMNFLIFGIFIEFFWIYLVFFKRIKKSILFRQDVAVDVAKSLACCYVLMYAHACLGMHACKSG